MMEGSPLRINNKIKQKLGGNWGHPSKDEKHIRIPEDIFPEEPRHIKTKRKKKSKKDFVFSWHRCPFCESRLPLDEKRIAEEKARLKNSPMISIWEMMYVVDTCPNCKSYEVRECPACKRRTWFNPETRMYKHQSPMSCGFIGAKKIV